MVFALDIMLYNRVLHPMKGTIMRRFVTLMVMIFASALAAAQDATCHSFMSVGITDQNINVGQGGIVARIWKLSPDRIGVGMEVNRSGHVSIAKEEFIRKGQEYVGLGGKYTSLSLRRDTSNVILIDLSTGSEPTILALRCSPSHYFLM